MSKDVAVVVQTHWDREWYYPHQTFLARLLRVMQQVVEQLDSGELKTFLFDGQVSAIEDFYTHAEPPLVERVRAHVQAGRIVIGPWYIMADEFLCAGESLVRNLEMGMSRAATHGRCQAVGYLPDTFGHIAQMPQILRGFGIDNAVAWRGIDAPQSEIQWLAPDGSRVFTVFLSEGYYQHPFNTADWQTALNSYLRKIVNRSGGGELLLTQGGDHLLTIENLQQKIESYNTEQGDFRLVQRSLEAYIRRVQAAHSDDEFPAVTGELRNNQTAFVLPDVLSTRQYLKDQNQSLEDRLTGLVEPLLALAAPMFEQAEYYPHHYLDQTWQLLIEQHAHDSICGCSVDAVHREMEVRFTQLHQRLDALTAQAQLALGMCNDRVSFHRDERAPDPFADDRRFSLFNPSPKPRSGWQVFTLFLRGEACEDLVIKNAAGDSLPSILIARESASEFHSPVDDFPDLVAGHRYTIALNMTLAGLQMQTCEVHSGTQDAAFTSGVVPGQHAIENACYRLSVNDNRLIIEDKRRGHRYDDALTLVSELDGGDTYNFSPVDEQYYRADILSCEVKTHSSVNSDHAVQTLVLRLRLRQPAGLDSDRGIDPAWVESEGELQLRLMPEDDYIDGQLEWENHARDQRLRLQLSLGKLVTHSGADSAFHWVEREKTYSDTTQVSGQQEAPVAVFPSYSAVSAGAVGFVHRGLQEAGVIAAGNEDRLAITLIRSVGWLSRRDLKTRGLGAGPDLPTPEAQCLRPHQFLFAFTLQQPEPVSLLQRAEAWRKPVTLLRGGGMAQLPGLQLKAPGLQLSSLRRVLREGVSVLEMRVWNPTQKPVHARFSCEDFTRVDLTGQVTDVAGDPAEVAPHQIATFVFPFDKLMNSKPPAETQHGQV
ncbi:hypothetical protein [Microbulbifer sp. Q7]|uniref:glycoside hydrolase family 38 N-terminal domain-containing protein n=1 Tax=Microbulbifer sp. Q7 TaxID=1785091 RepID=UPI00082FEEF3|nr:hypothetical protein [Microbulbifer sp. Q7]